MKGHGAKFGRRKEEAIAALLTQRNIDEAAKSIGISPNTLLSWMKQPEFDAAYREARRMVTRIRVDMVPADQDRVTFESGLSDVLEGLVDAVGELVEVL